MKASRDDIESYPGSATSLLRTIIGSTVRQQGGWMPASGFVALMETVDVPGGRTRTALTRLKAKGFLVSETRDGVQGYALADWAVTILDRGDRRIFVPRLMDDEQQWFIISFSVPEQDRDLRYQLKRRLAWIGCGSVAGALWIGPASLVEEAEEIVSDLGLDGRVTVFMVSGVRGQTPRRVAIERWWDLDTLRGLHDDFLAHHGRALENYREDSSPRNAFRVWIGALDAWRPIPYLDPGLPPTLLPEDWPGDQSMAIFSQLRDVVRIRADEYVDEVVAQGPVNRRQPKLAND